MRVAATLSLLLSSALLPGCIGTTPEEAAANALPDDGRYEGPTHRAGQPCLVCHDFTLAGTVYRLPDDEVGLEGAEVEVTDAEGVVFTAHTNRVGTFIVSTGGSDREDRRDGWLHLARAPVFPLRVVVRYQDEEQEMRNVFHREGACAACHTRDGPGAASAGPIFAVEPP